MKMVIVNVEIRLPLALYSGAQCVKNILIFAYEQVQEFCSRERVMDIAPEKRPLKEREWNHAQKFNDEYQRRL